MPTSIPLTCKGISTLRARHLHQQEFARDGALLEQLDREESQRRHSQGRVRLSARMARRERRMSRRMPILRHDDVLECRRDAIDDRDDFVAVRNSQEATREACAIPAMLAAAATKVRNAVLRFMRHGHLLAVAASGGFGDFSDASSVARSPKRLNRGSTWNEAYSRQPRS